MEGSATLSPCGTYRYDLVRRLSGGTGAVTWVLLNPSTADGERDDPTVRRVVGFSLRWGYRVARVCNLFALRATDPRALLRHADPVGPRNDEFLRRWCAPGESDRVVLAWGAHGAIRGRGAEVTELLRRLGAPRLSALTWTRGGHPGHPLYARADTAPNPLDARLPTPDTGAARG